MTTAKAKPKVVLLCGAGGAGKDTLANQLIIYGLLTLAWILLTAFGFSLVTKFSSWMLIGFLAVLIYMVVDVIVGPRQYGAGQKTIGIALQILRQHASLADAFQFAPYRNLEATVSTFLEFVGQSTFQPSAVMMVRPLVKMLVPQRPEAVHR